MNHQLIYKSMKNSREKKAFAGIYCKVFVIMTLCLCMVTNLWANSSSASPQRVTINLKDAAVKQVFAEIRKQTTYNFVYSDDQMDKLKPVTLNVTAETVDAVFAHALALPKKEAAVEHLTAMAGLERQEVRCGDQL